MNELKHFINGAWRESAGQQFGELFDPNSGRVQGRVHMGGTAEIQAAYEAANGALSQWGQLSPQKRAKVMFAFKRLLEEQMEPLAKLLSSEHGKTIADSKGDLIRGIEVIDFMCGLPSLLKGEYSDNAGSGIDIYSYRQPLGVCAGITPFNFPAMIPIWMFGVAIGCGNTFILKPSEKDPSVPLRFAELFMKAGAPPGTLNVVLGAKESVDAILAHPDIAAVSFVGSSDVAQYAYTRGSATGKRMQAMGGAKNHGVVMPDADLEQAASQIIGAAFGSAGERCMAMSVVVPVGDETAERLIDMLVEGIGKLRIGVSTDPQADFGPLVTAAHRQRVEQYIQLAIDEGAKPLIDGRGFTLPGHEKGFFLGATLLDQVTPNMRSYQSEIFGPVLQIVRARNFEEALAIPSRHQYGNGVSIFTRSGRQAREFARQVVVGMVGINIPIPVPLSYYSFGGWKRSAFGSANQYGMEGVHFWTRPKTVTQRWPQAQPLEQNFTIPTG